MYLANWPAIFFKAWNLITFYNLGVINVYIKASGAFCTGIASKKIYTADVMGESHYVSHRGEWKGWQGKWQKFTSNFLAHLVGADPGQKSGALQMF